MNKKIYLLLTVLLAWSFNLKAQTAQIEQVDDAIPGTTVSFDVVFTDIPVNVGAVSLFIGYDPNVLTFAGSTLVDPQFAGFLTNNMTASHQVGIQWSNPYGADINGAPGPVFTLQFNYSALGGTCDLIFGPGCEFADILLNSILVSYTNGSIAPDDAIATITLDTIYSTAGSLNGPSGVGVTGDGFAPNVGAMTLYIEFDETVLQYTGFTTTLTALTISGNNFTGLIAVAYSNTTGESLNKQFLTLNFVYDGTGPSDLVFKTGCEIAYTDMTVPIVSFDNGWVKPTPEGTQYKLTIKDVEENPGNVIEVPIKAEGFNPNLMGAITLHIGFNPAHLDFIDILGGSTISGASANLMGPGMIGITWSSTGALIDGDPFLTLRFDYNFGSSAITFEGGSEVADKFLTVFPTTFIDGSISPVADGPEARLPMLSGTIGQTIDFPVTVKNFPVTMDIAAISLFIGFDNTVLTYTGHTPGTISGYFINYMGATSQIGLQWSAYPAVDIDPSGEDILFTLHFTYNGGESDVTFDAGCEFALADLTSAPVAFFDGAVIAGSRFAIKVFLEGPFNGSTMYTGLNELGELPPNQPYSGAYWNYLGTESVSNIPNETVVDWVLLEFRETTGNVSTATSDSIVARQAAFLLNTGSIVGLDGSSEVIVPTVFTDNLYVVVYHRNHIRVMSASALTMIDGIYVYDFTDAVTKAFDSQQKDLNGDGSFFGMYAADGENDGEVFSGDLTVLLNEYPTFGGYNDADFDLDGEVFSGDLGFLLNNYPKFTSIP